MSGSYVVWLGENASDPALIAASLARAQRLYPELSITLQESHCAVASAGLPTHERTHGLILGRVHQAPGRTPAVFATHLADSDLIERRWGGYIAVSSGPECAQLLRAPLGDLPCYWLREGHSIYGASSPSLALTAAGRRPSIAWPALARHLAFGTLSQSETCLEGVNELRGGDRLMVSPADVACETLWSPWSFARPRPSTWSIAAEELHELVLSCVARIAAGHPRLVLKLSGGLDSSILAAALTASGRPFTGLTLFTDDRAGDERDYARLVARHFGFDLVEARRDPLRLDLSRSPSAGLARPSLPGFRQEADRLTAEVAKPLAASAVVDGGGGDNVFCSVQSASGVADCLRSRDGLRALLSTARSVSSIAQVSLAHVLRRAALRALSRRRHYRWPTERLFLADEVADALPMTPGHPWLLAPPGLPPGRGAHVALIAAAQSYVEGLDQDQVLPTLSPLLAQPIVEFCLSVPSWGWVEDGHNRALARRAFTGDLPPEIAWRRSKGSPECFVAQAFEVHRPTIRDMLYGGLLAEARLIDWVALDGALGGRAPPDDWAIDRIMILLDAEIWARSWTER